MLLHPIGRRDGLVYVGFRDLPAAALREVLVVLALTVDSATCASPSLARCAGRMVAQTGKEGEVNLLYSSRLPFKR